MNDGFTPNQDRLSSVDALRGLIMATMIAGYALVPVVHTLPHGALYEPVAAQLYHSSWHGLTLVDFRFAGFVMLMGLSVRLSLKRFRDDNLRPFLRKVVIRSCMLVVLGFLYNGGFREPWPDIRLCGVLQRMGICYFAAALIYRWTSVRGRMFLLVLILLGYWAIIAFIPVPEGLAGDYSFNGNLVAWIDSKLLPGRLYYGTWDPEGILSTLPAVGSAIVGILWGDLLLSPMSVDRKAAWLAGCGLCALNMSVLWDVVMPINKPMWTSSFVLATSGIGSLVLAALYYVIEKWNWRSLFFPFIVIGRNLLASFILIQAVPFHALALRFTGGDASVLLGSAAPFATAATEVLLLWGILLMLYRNGITIRI